jgi:hypothetical protein
MGDSLIRLSRAEFPVSTALFRFRTPACTDSGLNLWDGVAPAARSISPSEAISEEEQLNPLISELIKQNFVESNSVELSNSNYESN